MTMIFMLAYVTPFFVIGLGLIRLVIREGTWNKNSVTFCNKE